MPLEIELKLVCGPDVLAGVARHPSVRALKTGRARTEQLLSRYFDTPDRLLERSRIALRVRRTSRGWVQTVKTDGKTAHERPEWEWPVADGVPRGDVLGETPALKALGGMKRLSMALASLEPVFETDIRRTVHPLRFPDGTLAELCLDSGAVRAGASSEPISEVEIELRSGDSARLFELALALVETLPLRWGHASKAARGHALAVHARATPQKAGDVPLRADMSITQAFGAIASACMSHIQANEAGLAKARDPEYLHQMRVAVRRLRAALRIFRGALDPVLYAAVVDEMRALARALGVARDWDVFCAESLRPAASSFPHHAGIAGILRRGESARRANDRDARSSVAAQGYTRGLLQLAQLSGPAGAEVAASGSDRDDAHGGVSLTAFSAQALQRNHRHLRKLGRRLGELSDEELHNLRIHAKKLRYVAEFFQELYPSKKARGYARALAELQEVLGAVNDCAVGLRLLDQLAPAAGARRSGIASADAREAAAMLQGWLGAERRRHLQSLPAIWARFEDHPRYWKSALPEKGGDAAADASGAEETAGDAALKT